MPLPLPSVTGKAVALPCALAAAAQFGLISIMILAAVSMQSVLGYRAVISGLASLPPTSALAALAPLAGRLSERSPAACPDARRLQAELTARLSCGARCGRSGFSRHTAWSYRLEAQHVQRHPCDNGP